MSTAKTTRDKNGRAVREGDSVRILKVDKHMIEKLPSEEQEDVRSMVGKELEVKEIDEYGNAWVTQWWSHGEGEKKSHSLALEPEEMEVVSRGNGR